MCVCVVVMMMLTRGCAHSWHSSLCRLYSAFGMCGCNNNGAAVVLDGATSAQGTVASFWVRAPTAVPVNEAVYQPVQAFCDMGDAFDGGWTVVARSDRVSGDSDNSVAGLATRAYDVKLLPLVRGATEVQLSLRQRDGSGVPGAQSAAMPIPAAWRDAHPSAASPQGTDVTGWPVQLSSESTPSPRLLRYGAAGVDDSAGSACASAWVGSPGFTPAYTGLICVAGSEAPLWSGWATNSATATCDASSVSDGAAACTASRVFSLAVR